MVQIFCCDMVTHNSDTLFWMNGWHTIKIFCYDRATHTIQTFSYDWVTQNSNIPLWQGDTQFTHFVLSGWHQQFGCSTVTGSLDNSDTLLWPGDTCSMQVLCYDWMRCTIRILWDPQFRSLLSVDDAHTAQICCVRVTSQSTLYCDPVTPIDAVTSRVGSWCSISSVGHPV